MLPNLDASRLRTTDSIVANLTDINHFSTIELCNILEICVILPQKNLDSSYLYRKETNKERLNQNLLNAL